MSTRPRAHSSLMRRERQLGEGDLRGAARRNVKLAVSVLALALAGCEGMAGDMPPSHDSGSSSVDDSGMPMMMAPPDAGQADAGDPSTPDAGNADSGSNPLPMDAGGPLADADAGPQPDLAVSFPPPGSATSDTHLLVHGTTRAGLSVSSVQVAGASATSTDGFLTWQLDVPLSLGTNTLAVDFTAGGQLHTAFATVVVQRFSDEASVTRGTGAWAGRVLGLAWDALGGRVILADDVDDGVWGVTATTGNRVELADSESTKIGSGVDITQPRSGVVRGNTSYVLDAPSVGGVDMPNITALDLTTGDRSIAAQLPAVLNDIALLPNGIEAIGASLDVKSVLAVNLVTGTSRVVSSSTVGSGIAAGNFGPLGLSTARRTAYVGLRYQDTVVAIDIDTGDRSAFSVAASGEPHFNDPEFIVVDDAVQKAFVWDSNQLVAIDLTTGRRALFGTGPFAWATAVKAMTSTPFGITLCDYVPSWEPPPQRAPTLVVFDPLTGTRVVLSR